MKKLLLLIFFVSLCLPCFASHKYTLEKSEALKESGKIEWREYGPEAFNEATEKNKPIFLFLTAPTWCYWCHVYDSEDYLYNPKLYPVLNDLTIPVYVNADKRQDLTRHYLEGGWPSTTLLTPNGKRLFGFSGPRPIENIIANIQKSNTQISTTGFTHSHKLNYTKKAPYAPSLEALKNLSNNFIRFSASRFDEKHGGFGSRQKFPQGLTLDAFLEKYDETKDTMWLRFVEQTLQNQYTFKSEMKTNYNLFDPIEGGFHRYGTKRDWTPPHYEKMLYDNVKLLKAYTHLLKINPSNKFCKEVVDKTRKFIADVMYDHERGGFYSNVDVHGEDTYYGTENRPTEKPFVEKTKYTDWESEAAYLYFRIGKSTETKSYTRLAKQTLDFLIQNIISENGAYHYIEENGTKAVTGNILDNANLLLALVEGYESTKDIRYLNTAKDIANYSLNNLYDWNSGGFFERNSKDTKLYTANELIKVSKPNEENGVIILALAKLYKNTKDLRYLNACIKSLGQMIGQVGVLDRGYYYYQAANYIINNNLIKEYESNSTTLEALDKVEQTKFWLNQILYPEKYPRTTDLELETGEIKRIENKAEKTNLQFEASEEGLNKPSSPLLLLLLISFIAGLLSFLSPCTLPILPAYLACTLKTDKKKQFFMSLSFLTGLTLMFSLLGMTASTVGQFLRMNLVLFTQIAGGVLMGFGAMIILGKELPLPRIQTKESSSYFGAACVGVTMGLSWTPCIDPIIASILILASTTSSALTGGVLLFSYGLGLGLPLLLISFYLEKIDKESTFWKLLKGKELTFNFGSKKRAVHSTTLVSGLLFISLGYLIFNGMLVNINQYLSTLQFQESFSGIHEKLLGLMKI